jgi:mannose-6-phosphate isomerase-like protein (cupin superfamily)
MKLLLAVPLFALAFLQGGSAAGPAATHISNATVNGCAKAGSFLKVPNEYEVICYNKGNAVPDGAEVHTTHTHVFYIVDGDAILVTGGTLVPASGDKLPIITGGVENHVTKGDVIVIPTGTPHWYKEVRTPVAYYSVNVVARP